MILFVLVFLLGAVSIIAVAALVEAQQLEGFWLAAEDDLDEASAALEDAEKACEIYAKGIDLYLAAQGTG